MAKSTEGGNKKWAVRYHLALRFASFFNSDHRYDIVHDAWIYYTNKEGVDLFEIDLKNESSYLYTVVKNAFYRWWYKERTGDKYQYLTADSLQSTLAGPVDILIAKDLYAQFYSKLFEATKETDKRHYRTPQSRELPLSIFRLKAEGHTQKEIADELRVSKQVVNHYVKKIEQMASINPFNGSRVKVTRVIALSTWYGLKDKSDYEENDSNEWYKLYTHAESKDGLLVKLKKDE